MKKKLKHVPRVLRGIGWTVAGIVSAYVVIATTVTVIYVHRHAHDPYLLGVSFSTKYAEELGLDWRQTFTALLDDAHVRRFRLMSYWDKIEPQPGQYDFSDLDWQLAEAQKRGAKVTLAIGLRQPRWPECHQPDWADKLQTSDNAAWKHALDQYLVAVLDHYKSSDVIVSYQLENEALNTAFGACHDFSRQRLVDEYNLVKREDPNHPVMLSVSNEFGLPLGAPRPDISGFSVYQRVYQRWGKFYFNYPFPPLWHGSRAAIIEVFLHEQVIIHELQTEPWGPVATVKMTIPEQNQSMDAKRVLQTVAYAKGTGIHEIYLWGGEWWYWRLTKFHDPSLWNAAKQIYAQ